jgi:hypothetical protein
MNNSCRAPVSIVLEKVLTAYKARETGRKSYKFVWSFLKPEEKLRAELMERRRATGHLESPPEDSARIRSNRVQGLNL